MEEYRKTKAELIDELLRTRQQIAESERKNIEQQHSENETRWNEYRLRESEERYRVAIEHSNDGVAIVKGDRLLYVNSKFLEVFGYDSPDEVLGRSLEVTVHPDDRERVIGYARSRQLKAPVPSRYEFKGMRKDGMIVFVEASATTTYLAGESVSLAYLRDVTARKQAQEALEARLRIEEFICNISTRFIDIRTHEIDSEITNVLRSVGGFAAADNVHLVLFRTDGTGPERGYQWLDGAFGQSIDDVNRLLPFNWLRGQLSVSDMLRVTETDLPSEAVVEKKAWDTLGVKSVLAIPLNTTRGLIGCVALPSLRQVRHWAEADVLVLRLVGEILANVLNRKTMEESIQLNEGRMKALLNAIPDTMLRIGTDGNILDFKTGDGEGFFKSCQFRIGRSVGETLLPQEISSNIMAATKRAVQSDQVEQYEWSLTADNKPLAFEVRIVKSGEKEAVCIIRNVSERMASEQALRESESKFRNLSEQSMTGIYLIQGNTYRYVNRQLAEIFGYREDEIIGRKGPGDLVHREDRSTVLENVEKRISGEAGSMHYEFRGVRKNGESVNVEVYDSGTTYQGRSAIIGTLLDISDRKRLEAQLIQSEKMKAIGTLSGGIAHDFNNILMAIQGYTSLMLHLLEPEHGHYSKLKGIEELVTSGSDLTKQLLAFASGGTYEIRSADLNEILRKTSSMFARTRKEITIQARYETEVPVVDVDRGQIEQMLLNLYVNAWQAMPGGGTLILTTENVLLDKKLVRASSVKPGRFAKISVTDTGTGMDEKTRERIFEPFFTTKKRGRGTGLGLASVYNIVVGHGGIIQVESEPGCGTTFHIYLPLSKKTVEKAEPISQAVLNGKETVLLVDDEETVITVSRDMLEALGYSVLVAGNGQEACEVYRKNWEAVDLVILDLIMPDMGGEETFIQLTNINPSVNVILSSGYSLDGIATKIMDRGCRAFIQKPFTINLLSQKLREVLGANS
jgi:two-component system, cell cycle sensor histidine kinase and response regulator CckA